MSYTKPLPRLRRLELLATLAGTYPQTAQQLLLTAKRWRCGPSITDFLQLFPADELFATKDEFMNRARELELLIRESRTQPSERLRSPQD
ncbi:MAG TPA: hypothetical protein VFN56_04710 [Candidatus Saccharimonadales bacterium]|nr:hypothetical protein [Candidatus Saccharimonadales bacterium]